MKDPAARWKILGLGEQALDGTLTPGQEAELEALLREDPEARALFASTLHLDAELRLDPRLARGLAEAPPVKKARNILPFIGLAAAACVAIGVSVFSFKRPPGSQGPGQVATVVKGIGCKWAGSTLPTAEGSRVGPGTLELLEGLATLKFDSGAEVVMEAPATLEIVDAMNCRLKRGTIVADVPHTAIGFTVDTKDAKVVDLGTRFGVSADDQGKYLVHVIDGLVEVGHKGEQGMKKVTTGQNLDRGLLRAKLNPQASPDEPNRWHPDTIIRDSQGWQTISTTFGGGKDSYIQPGKTPRNFGKEAYMRVKRSTFDETLNRKGYIGFDLAKFDKSKIEEAEVSLSIEPSDLGFATLVPDSTFIVYGLTEQSSDGWDEMGITWANAPAMPGPGLPQNLPDPDKVVRLGSFTVPQGTSRGARGISGPALVDFLKADTDGIATFIICRETNENSKDGLVHAFATSENRSNTPPLLRVRIKE